MPEFLYRVDIYLPVKDNAGELVSPAKFRRIKNQILAQFGGLTITSMWGNPTYTGFWRSPETGVLYQDKNTIFTVLAPQSDKTVTFFMRQKEQWKSELEQEEILLTLFELQTL